MKIIFACGAMPFGPETPTRASLGGSETACLMLAKAVAARGHDVTLFCNLPPQGAPDFFPSGEKHSDGVRYVTLAYFQEFVTSQPHDVLIAMRDPKMVSMPTLSRKKVLWMHDIATKRGYGAQFQQMEFTFDEIWAVSEWHKFQIAEATGYPEARIIALRNGIVKHEGIINLGGVEGQLLYASRPERGLENLIRPGGIMEHLPEYTLNVAMYEHFPEHMREFYTWIMQRMEALPNVRFVGGKPNAELRQMIADSAAYIYPTQFEETSCILARECMEQGTPFITTSIGALPETLGEEGIYFEDWLHGNGINEPARGSDGWCKLFAQFFRERMAETCVLSSVSQAMQRRTDLYWDGVAEIVEPRLRPKTPGRFSHIWSLLQDGDAIPALALWDSLEGDITDETATLNSELDLYRRMLKMDLGEYYDELYRLKAGGPESELHFQLDCVGARYQVIAEQIAKLPPGSKVFEYGCGPGHVIAPLAKAFPQIEFIGFDFSPAAVQVIIDGAAEHGLTNLTATAVLATVPHDKKFDAVYCTEVLEHVAEPWTLLEEVESYAKPGGRVICTTPFGAWEPISYQRKGHWHERYHLWQIDRQMFKDMVGEKPNESGALLVLTFDGDLRPRGNFAFSYDANHEPINEIDVLAKAERHFARHTTAAAVIAYNNEDTILRMLNSLEHKVQYVQIAHGPSTDKTRELIDGWFADRPWMRYNVIDVPKIEPYQFGFDDARNCSMQGLTPENFEWFLWIDTDEYLAGDFRKYLRDSSLDGYCLAQHHFTVEPRGRAAEIDRPVRLCRTDRNYRAYGHIHEHFEITLPNGANGGPGRAILLPDVDVGHTGYVNEEVRRGRFFRNFPFLEWDHEEGNPRKLHHFLWLRDLVHRMRFDEQNRRKLAAEAISYYNEHQEDMSAFGPGMFMSIQYMGEALTVLGRGMPVGVGLQLGDKKTEFGGVFENYEQVEKVFKQLLAPEFEERLSRYY
jgi:ubiquinone/menaquinone biosynthesis C-methylase UbiE/glycosyltransferase involved in cell wall biosynthesis